MSVFQNQLRGVSTTASGSIVFQSPTIKEFEKTNRKPNSPPNPEHNVMNSWCSVGYSLYHIDLFDKFNPKTYLYKISHK